MAWNPTYHTRRYYARYFGFIPLAEGRRRKDQLEALIPRLRSEIEIRERQELEATLRTREAEYAAECASVRKALLTEYPQLAQKIGALMARCADVERRRQQLRRELETAGLSADALQPLTAETEEGRPETQLAMLWDERDGVVLPSVYRDHGPAFSYWPRDARSEAELLAPPSPRYVPTPAEPEGPRPMIVQELPDGRRVADYGVTRGGSR